MSKRNLKEQLSKLCGDRHGTKAGDGQHFSKHLRDKPSVPENRIVFNVGGVRFETYRSTLKNIPDTRLAWLATNASEQNPDFDSSVGEFFFDRHPGVFLMILNYYRTGKLHAPSDICGPMFEEELAFWGIDENQIEPCCWTNYRTFREAQETLKEFDDEGSTCDDEEFFVDGQHKHKPWWRKWRPRVWRLLDDPHSSRGAKAYTIISILFVLISIGEFCAESHLLFRVPVEGFLNQTTPNPTMTVLRQNEITQPHISLKIIEWMCMGLFTLELAIRLVFCPNKCDFFKAPMNWVDLLSVLPFYFILLIVTIDEDLEQTPALQFVKIMRIIRIFRIFKLTKHFTGLKILWHTIRRSAKELLLLIVIVFLGVLIFSVLIYYAEQLNEHPENDFTSIPLGFWWAVVTMTTLGYGDMYPRTMTGYLVGTCCALAGVLVIALPVPVIVNNFTLYYSHAQAKLKLPKKKNTIFFGAAAVFKQQAQDVIALTSRDFSLTPSELFDAQQQDVPVPHPPPCPIVASDDGTETSDDSGIKSSRCSEIPPTSKRSAGISVTFTDDEEDTKRSPSTSKTVPASNHSPQTTAPSCASPVLGRRHNLMPNGYVAHFDQYTESEDTHDSEDGPSEIEREMPTFVVKMQETEDAEAVARKKEELQTVVNHLHTPTTNRITCRRNSFVHSMSFPSCQMPKINV